MEINTEISNTIDNIFDIISKADTNKNLSDEQVVLLKNFKDKYSSNLYISCVTNYYKIKIISFGENIKHDIFLDQIINFIENIKSKIELLTKDINLMNIILDILSKSLYDKIIKTNIKNLSEIKELKLIQKINLINKLNKIELKFESVFGNINTNTNSNTILDLKNIFKPVDNLLFGELKEKIKIMDDGLVNSWITSGSRKYYDVYESYLEMIKSMRELNELSKLVDYILIKDKIKNKICWFYTKYLDQINLDELPNILVLPIDLNKTFVNSNTLYKMIDDLDGINVGLESKEKTIKKIQEKIDTYEKIIFTFVLGLVKKIFRSSITEITKDFFVLSSSNNTQSKIYEITEKFIKKEAITNKKIAFEYFKKTNQILCKELRICLLTNLDTYSKQKISQFVEWFEGIKLELANQIRENIEESEYDDPDITKLINMIFVKTNLIIEYLEYDNSKNGNIDENIWKEKFIAIFNTDKEYLQLYKYKSNKFNPVNKVLAGGTKIINSVGNDITNISSGLTSITKNSINTVNNISSNTVNNISTGITVPKIIPNINLFDKK